MQKITPREVLRSTGFKTMLLGLGIGIIGVLFAVIGLIPIAQGLVALGIGITLVGFLLHARLFISIFFSGRKK